jgi:plastocyanin
LTSLLVLAWAIVASSFAVVPSSGTSASIALFGNAADGWGLSNATISDPGPTLSFDLGDTITITIWGNDSTPHNWFIDYNGNNIPDAGEPSTEEINTTVLTVTDAFVLDRAGSFTYRCMFHPATMRGTINVASPSSTPPPADNTLLIVGGLVVVVALVAVAAFMMRRKPKSPPQPPSS